VFSTPTAVQAESASVPATVTATPTRALASGDTVGITVAADANYSIYQVRARLCKASADINNAGDFAPTLAGNCVNGPLAVGTDSDEVVLTSPGARTSASLNFKVGAGSTTFTKQDNTSTTISCGSSTPTSCKIAIEISMVNPGGTGVLYYKDIPITYGTLPGAPTTVLAPHGVGQSVVSWTAPASAGTSSITSYTATSSPGGRTCTTASTSCTVTGLTNGTAYTFTVKATSAVGEGPASVASASVTPTTDPFVITASPTTGLVNGTAVTVGVAVDAGYSLYQTRVRLCTSSSSVTNAGDFAPTIGGMCVNAPLANGSDSDRVSLTTPSNRVSTSTTFRVGAGSTTFTKQDSTSTTIACGTTSPSTCRLVVEISMATPSSVGLVVHRPIALTYTSAPAAPTNVSGISGDGEVTVSWTPGSNNGSNITGYTVSASPQVGGVTRTCTTASTSCAVTGLTNGTAYTFTVKATNAIGDSLASSASSAVTPASSAASAPGAPTSVSGVSGNAQVTVSWSAPVSNGGSNITGYTVSASPQVSGVTRTCTTASTSCIVTGLTNGTAYTFTVKATNAIGDSSASTASSAVTPSTVPGLPSGVYAVRGNNSVTIYWTAATVNGGSAITNYQAQAYNTTFGTAILGKTCSNNIFRYCTITGLTNGTNYRFAVRATNVKGWGAFSALTPIMSPSASLATAPGVPTNVVITPGNREVTVSWTAPANNGAQITGYKVQAYGAAGAALINSCTVNALTSTATSCTLPGLSNDTTYGFAVNATNLRGSSAYSTIGQVQPTLVKIRRGNAKVTGSWTFTAPSTFRGAAFSSYQVQAYTSNGAAVVGKTCTPVGSAKTCDITGLTNNTQYSVAVIARYVGGTSFTTARSITVAPSSLVGATAPVAPTGVTALAGVKQVTVSWTASAANGATVTLYTVQAYNPLNNQVVATKLCTTSVTSCAVTGLTTGTSYYFKVTARNDAGTSVASSATTTVTAG
jgi:hypothetical protein